MGTDGAEVLGSSFRRLSLLPLVLVLVLAACGGNESAAGPTLSPREAVKQAAANMQAAGSVRYSAESKWRIRHLAEKPFPVSVKGLAGLDGKRAWVWIDGSKLYPILLSSRAPRGEREIARDYYENDKGWQVEARQLGKKEWERIPALSELAGTKPWLLYTDPRASATSIEVGQLWSTPLGILVALRALRHVKEAGTDTIDGRNTTRYRGRVELRRLKSPLKKYRAGLRKTIGEVIRQTGKRSLPLEVWIDEEGLPRRVRLTEIDPKEEPIGFLVRIRATMDLPEYGVDFHVPRPAASKVVTEEEFDRRTRS